MTDYFAVFGEPRRPWLDPESLKDKFLELSSKSHPDRVHALNEAERQKAQDDFTQLNAAYNCLRDSRNRLRHLLELERGTPPNEIQQIPSDLMAVFMQVGQTMRQVDAFLVERSRISSPLLKVQLFERGQEWTRQLQLLQADIHAKCAKLEQYLKTIDMEWSLQPAQHQGLLGQFENIYRLLGYYERWKSQLQERIVQISF